MNSIPTFQIPTLYHIGTMDATHRGEQGESLEGHLLSVSLCPRDWKSIARLGGRPLHHLSKPDGITMFDALAAAQNPQLKAQIEAWAIENGLAEQRTLWKAWFYDCEFNEDDPNAWRYALYETEAKAANEIEDDEAGGPNGPAVEPITLLVGTAELASRVKRRDLSTTDSFDYAALIWAEQTQPHLDGVYWNERFDPDSLSAPRGGIFPAKIADISIRQIDWRHAPVHDELIDGAGAEEQDTETFIRRSSTFSL